MNDAPSGYRIEQALSAWQSTRARLLTEDADMAQDEAALSALLGPAEGDVRDILARLLRGAQHARDMADAASERVDQVRARQERYKRRAEQMRATAFAIMDALGERKIELPDLTASIAGGRQSVVIVDETAIPDAFVKISRTPDKTALLSSLKAGEAIPGAELSNGLPQLQIRGK